MVENLVKIFEIFEKNCEYFDKKSLQNGSNIRKIAEFFIKIFKISEKRKNIEKLS